MYEHLDANGLPSCGDLISPSQAVIGLVEYDRPTNKIRDRSTILWSAMRSSASFRVAAVCTANSADGQKVSKVLLSEVKEPSVGDKFTSRAGQKGVIGLIVDECDMPVTADGVIPDFIINCNAFPSRMTIGHLKESLSGKLAAADGSYVDGSIFADFDLEDISRRLEEHGIRGDGREPMYNGLTGERMDDFFIGPTFYQRLKHIAADKMHARGPGAVDPITRQPPQGRARNGGFRLGEMEKDCLISHGCSYMLHEKLTVHSDGGNAEAFDGINIVYVCDSCGKVAQMANTLEDTPHLTCPTGDPRTPVFNCTFCDNTTMFTAVPCGHATKSFLQTVMATGSVMRIKT